MSIRQIIAIANQKGGVGKTTTAINIGAALTELGHAVTLIDLDPQGNASTGLGIKADQRDLTIYDILAGDAELDSVAQQTNVLGLRVVPATSDLSSAEAEFSQIPHRLRLLDRAVKRATGHDIVLIDCPPALGLLTLNAMVAATSVLVPLQAEFYALEGLSQLLATVKEVRNSANPALRINGIILTMSDYRNNLSQQVEADVRATLGELVYQTVIPRNVRVSESPSHSMPVLNYDPTSKGSQAYRHLAQEFAERLKLISETA
ncbi:MAG: ParA family protein [Paracoccus sp. (in: a-proteobacteria)]|nr:ParA family protein [Paracoccus sp. (in: a-proteobacteria)]